MLKAFENNEVLLWGEKQAPQKLINEFGVGNKNPISTARKKPSKEKEIKVDKIPKKKIFDPEGDYGINDLDFLNGEYDRIDKEISKTKDINELDELMELQEKIYELIEGLEHFKKLKGGNGITNKISSNDETIIDNKVLNNPLGFGFKKGSPEAIEHARKMREKLEAKKAEKPVEKVIKKSISSRARAVKGSEEAKALGQRLAEARKKKAEAKKAEEELSKKPIEKVIKKTGKPWFYIGDIPKGYREATEDEAIMAKKVSTYGKYAVDMTKWTLYRDYEILLSHDKTEQEMEWSMNGLKRRTLDSLKEIEILKNRINSDKYKDKLTENTAKLEEEKEKRKYLNAGYNFYKKNICEKQGKEYKRELLKLPIKEIKESKTEEEWKPTPRPIDPRTGKEIELILPKEEIKEEKKMGIVDVMLPFENGSNVLDLSTKYFTQDYKLKPKYAKKLIEKGIYLQKKYYTTDDYDKYFFNMKAIGRSINNIEGSGIVEDKPDYNKNDVIQSVVFDKDYWDEEKAKNWLDEHKLKSDNVDKKTTQLRYRQLNPYDLTEYHFISKKLKNHIMLIIAIKNN